MAFVNFFAIEQLRLNERFSYCFVTHHCPFECFDYTFCVFFSLLKLELLRKKQRAIVDNNPNHLAAACKSLGDWYHENQEYEKALECYNEEAGVHKSLGNRLENSKAHRMIGEMYMLLEKFDEALKHELIYLSMYIVLFLHL